MKPPPEDGCLEEITSSGSNYEVNVIIIRRPDEFKEPGDTTYTLATLDRSKEGDKWPGDQVLEKLFPELPKVKSPEVKKPEVTVKTNTPVKPRIKRKVNTKPVQKDNNFTASRRPKPPHKKLRSDRPGNKLNADNIDPWVCKPWENQAFLSGIQTASSVNATSLISDVPFNNFPSQSFPSKTSNIFDFPNNSGYERNLKLTDASDISFLNTHMEQLNKPHPANRIPNGPSFPPPTRYHWPNNGFRGPDSNADFNASAQSADVLGNSPIAGYKFKQGLLGDRPLSIPFKRNLAVFPNNMPTQTNVEGNATTLLPGDIKNACDHNSFISRPTFEKYAHINEISGRGLRDLYEHPISMGDSFRNINDANFSRFQNRGIPANNYENQYRNNYKHLDHNYPNDNNKNIISLKNPRDSYKKNYRKYKKNSLGVSCYKSGYMGVENDDLCKNDYDQNQISGVSDPSFMNNLSQNLEDNSVVHVSDSAVVYNQEDFQNDTYPVNANSSLPRSNLNSVSRFNRGNISQKKTFLKKRNWTTNKFTNHGLNKDKSNHGQQKSRNWRRPRR